MMLGHAGMKSILKFSRYHEYAVVLGLLAVLLVQLFWSSERINLLGDETSHLGAGYSYWKTRDFRLNREHPPLAKLVGAAPLMFEDVSTQRSWPYFLSAHEWNTATMNQWDFGRTLLLEDNGERLESILRAARRSESVFVLFLAICVYTLSRKLFGVRGGLISLLALVFNPDILAHGGLVTTDMAMAAFYFATLACLWWYLGRPSLFRLVCIGILLGLGLASKYSSVLLFPVLAVLLAVAWAVKADCTQTKMSWVNPLGQGATAKRAIYAVTACIIVLAAAAMVLWASYLYVEPFSQWWSGYLQVYKNINPGFENFLLGEYSAHPFWNYFLVTTALKTPLPVFVLLALAIAAFWVHWRNTLTPITQWVLLFPPLILFIIMSVKAVDIGHRYILGIYPYLFVLLGMAAYWLRDIGKQSVQCCSVLALLTFVGLAATVRSGIGAYPFYLSYHNALVSSDLDFTDYLDDSNNDWGQGWKELARIQKAEHMPPLFVYQFFSLAGDEGGIRGNWVNKRLMANNPAPGIHALSATLYRRNQYWFQRHGLFHPLLQQYKPTRMIAGAIVLIDVPYPNLVEQDQSLLTETALYPNGQLQVLSHYYLNEDGDKVLSGIYQTWNEKSDLTQTAFYIDGQLSGPYSLWANGRLMESGYMWNGKLHGTAYRWDKSGKLTNTFYYLEGKLMADR